MEHKTSTKKAKCLVALRQKLVLKGLDVFSNNNGKVAEDKTKIAVVKADAKQHPKKYSWSLYLDFYRNGKREYDFLKLYLTPENTPIDKESNRKTLETANAIRMQRELEVLNGESGLKKSQYEQMLVVDLVRLFQKDYEKRGKYTRSVKLRQTRLERFLQETHNGKATLKDINKRFCISYIDYLRTAKTTYDNGSMLSASSQKTYLAFFSAMLSFAYRKEYIKTNPFLTLDVTEKPRARTTERVILTEEELKKMIDTPAKRDDIKTAFLFSCFCGLRISDILRLKWENVEHTQGRTRLRIVQKKTSEPLTLDLNTMAERYLPSRGTKNSHDLVFLSLPRTEADTTINTNLKRWAKTAGIVKNISFHTARHTFATLLITKGADLYTTSKLMGHSRIETTQIYAKIIDKKKTEAMHLLDNVF
ncbi:MAG: tyrosine-type recombinase/integrase [Bacteroidales bacterium]|nr:tyrosine-type recombinase/integrase [Bacteroidales bacterium]